MKTRYARLMTLKAAEGLHNKVSLFKTVRMLHSGELFGIAGRIMVGIIAVTIIFLCLTRIAIFILPPGCVRWSSDDTRPHLGAHNPPATGFSLILGIAARPIRL